MHEIAITSDRVVNTWTLHCVRVGISSTGDVIAWRTLLSTEMTKVGIGRVDLLVEINGLSLDPSLGALFVSLTMAICEPLARSILFYGRVSERTKSALGLGSPAPVIEPTRELALRSLKRIRDARSRGAPVFDSDVVMRRSETRPRIATLREHFDALNAAHFGGRLPPAEIVRSTKAVEVRTTHAVVGRTTVRVIGIDETLLDQEEQTAIDALLHQMIHYAIAGEHNGDGDWKHRERFTSLANVIGARFGMPTVMSGTPAAAQWPRVWREAMKRSR